jgi:hypothetical protein
LGRQLTVCIVDSAWEQKKLDASLSWLTGQGKMFDCPFGCVAELSLFRLYARAPQKSTKKPPAESTSTGGFFNWIPCSKFNQCSPATDLLPGAGRMISFSLPCCFPSFGQNRITD